MLSSRPVSIHTDFPQGASFKTPGRALQNRAALQENAATKAKKAFQTPFKPPPTAQPPPGKGAPSNAGKAPLLTLARPLGDKTPFPNRNRDVARTPFPLAQIALDPVPGLTPGSALRPSSTRQTVRRSSRTSGSLGLGDVSGLNLTALGLGTFQTPRVNGNPWDVEDIELGQSTNGVQEVVEEEEVEIEDYDEMEYMPPKAVELPYEPWFAMPDYKALGRTLATFPYTFQVDDVPAYPAHAPSEEQALLESASFVPTPLTTDDTTPFYFSRTPSPPPTPPTIPPLTRRPLSRPAPSAASTRAPSATKSTPAVPTSRFATTSRLGAAKTAAPAGSRALAARPATSMMRRPPPLPTSRLAPQPSTSRLAPSASKPRITPSASTVKLAPPASNSRGGATAASSRATVALRAGPSTTAARVPAQSSRPATTSSARGAASTARSPAVRAGPSRPSRMEAKPSAAAKGATDMVLTFEGTRDGDEDFRFEL